MNSYTKEFVHNGQRFSIIVNLNTKVEKRINGDRWHTIQCNNTGPGNYYEKIEVLDANLEKSIMDIESSAKASVDKILPNETEQEILLKKLGFK